MTPFTGYRKNLGGELPEPGYWNVTDVTQKSNVPAVLVELGWNWIFGVLGAPASAVPVAGAQQVVLKLLQATVWVAAVITAQ
jgi:hypothetical protein